jgi:hypothetical protein
MPTKNGVVLRLYAQKLIKNSSFKLIGQPQGTKTVGEVSCGSGA